MLESLLIANRGEIACRIIRTAKRLGIRTVAIYSEADADALHVVHADQSVCVGPARATESYLDIDKIVDAARATDAQGVHPGYGFLSENAAFAARCAEAGIIFVGPPASAIESMGSKMEAKRLMAEADVPILPGYHGPIQEPDHLLREAETVGFPLLIKASAGGGGKGMRLVESAEDFVAQLEGAQREARSAFGNDAVLLERFLTAPKHIEVQIMADTHGNVVHLFERDCSVQRRHQKVIEEAPAPSISSAMRAALGQAAIAAAQQVGYVGAGTVEFISEGNDFYFMEMNTRLQVEHPVTEAVTGLDLVELQLRVAAGEPLGLGQDDIPRKGHAIEVRLYAENPGKRFLPSTGRLDYFELPDGIRVDTGVRAGDEVTMHYDPMLAKLIAHGEDRDMAINKLVDALAHARVAGVDHNLGYLREILHTPEFRAGDYTTGLADLVHEAVVPQRVLEFAVMAALARFAGDETSPWRTHDGFRLNLPNYQVLRLRQGKKEYAVELAADAARVNGESLELRDIGYIGEDVRARIAGDALQARVLRLGHTVYVMADGHTEKFVDLTDDLSRYQKQALSRGGIVAPMPGQVIAVNVSPGDKVRAGDALVIVEAMKMEHGVASPRDGIVKQVCCAAGDRVEEGVELVELE
jgi:3-methylcrotonyl-CoA carboxylase alpha subunit